MFNRKFEIRITHKPTGLSVFRSSDQFRSEIIARESAMRQLRSKVYMHGHQPMKENELIFEPCSNQDAT